MMKRSHGVHLLICFVLGMAVGDFLVLAIQNSSIFYGLEAVAATVASVLNIACGYDKSKTK